MGPEAIGIDELRLVDDPVDFLMFGDELEVGGERAALVQGIAGVSKGRRNQVANGERAGRKKAVALRSVTYWAVVRP